MGLNPCAGKKVYEVQILGPLNRPLYSGFSEMSIFQIFWKPNVQSLPKRNINKEIPKT